MQPLPLVLHCTAAPVAGFRVASPQPTGRRALCCARGAPTLPAPPPCCGRCCTSLPARSWRWSGWPTSPLPRGGTTCTNTTNGRVRVAPRSSASGARQWAALSSAGALRGRLCADAAFVGALPSWLAACWHAACAAAYTLTHVTAPAAPAAAPGGTHPAAPLLARVPLHAPCVPWPQPPAGRTVLEVLADFKSAQVPLEWLLQVGRSTLTPRLACPHLPSACSVEVAMLAFWHAVSQTALPRPAPRAAAGRPTPQAPRLQHCLVAARPPPLRPAGGGHC